MNFPNNLLKLSILSAMVATLMGSGVGLNEFNPPLLASEKTFNSEFILTSIDKDGKASFKTVAASYARDASGNLTLNVDGKEFKFTTEGQPTEPLSFFGATKYSGYRREEGDEVVGISSYETTDPFDYYGLDGTNVSVWGFYNRVTGGASDFGVVAFGELSKDIPSAKSATYSGSFAASVSSKTEGSDSWRGGTEITTNFDTSKISGKFTYIKSLSTGGNGSGNLEIIDGKITSDGFTGTLKSDQKFDDDYGKLNSGSFLGKFYGDDVAEIAGSGQLTTVNRSVSFGFVAEK